MNTRVIRRRVARKGNESFPLILVLPIVLAALVWVANRGWDTEFPPYATLSAGTVEVRVVTDKENPARLKTMVGVATAIGWERYSVEKPFLRCDITPLATTQEYRASCTFVGEEDKYVFVQLLTDNETVEAFLADLYRDATRGKKEA